jgi:thiamine-phosphate pyrophosphorylase
VGASRLIGASSHSVSRAVDTVTAGADLITIGPVWETPSKAAFGPPQGIGVVRETARAVGGAAAVFALGGVDSPERAAEAVRAGAWGVGVIRAARLAAQLIDAMEEAACSSAR